jgi:DNA topoisomerase-1
VTLPDEGGKPGQRKPLELSTFACAKCGKPLIHRKKPGKGGYDFWGCSGFKDGCKASYENKNGKPDFDKAK